MVIICMNKNIFKHFIYDKSKIFTLCMLLFACINAYDDIYGF